MNELAIYQEFDNIQRAAMALYKSGYFTDAKSEAQAIVKVMAGAELGLPPFASMSGIHIIQGKPALGSNIIATLVKNDPRYNYKLVEATDKKCDIKWFEYTDYVGSSCFTIEEAERAGLTTNPSWKKYPSDMLFARAISRGARRYAPGIFGGSPIYTPEELGADEDEDGRIVHHVPASVMDADIVTIYPSDVPVETVDHAETLRELGYEVTVTELPSSEMSLEFAENEVGSDNMRYGDKDSATLVMMANSIQKKMDAGGYTDDNLETYQRKLAAIRTILAARNS